MKERYKFRVLVQPYAAYKGHFFKYSSNLSGFFDKFIRSTRVDSNFEGSLEVPRSVDWKAFLRWKVLDALDAYRQIPYFCEVLHIVDFEPIAAIFTFHHIASAKSLIVTIHSVSASETHLHKMGLAARVHKALTLLTLRLLMRICKTRIVVHYEVQKNTLIKAGFPSDYVTTIPYPVTYFKTNIDKLIKGNILVFGNLRLDKDPLDILRSLNNSGLQVTIAGSIDPKLLKDLKPLGFKIIDRYITDEELCELFSEAEYVLLAYGPKYKGGAGPMKDAIGSGRPVIAPSYPLFQEIISRHDVGLLFSESINIKSQIEILSSSRYHQILRNVEKYRETYTWDFMRLSYDKLYAQ